jgi:hypothetical protein
VQCRGRGPLARHDSSGTSGPPVVRHARCLAHATAASGRIVRRVLLLVLDDSQPDGDLPRIFGEARRVLRAGGFILVAFQSGHGTQDVSAAYRRHGHDITLERYNRTPQQISTVLAAAGLQEVARLERQPAGAHERDSQAVVIAKG